MSQGDEESRPIGKPGLDPEFLERIRRGFPLELDARGRLLHEGDEITHPGVLEVFRRGFELNDEGEPIIQVGEQWTYLNPRDCVFRVVGVRGSVPARPELELDDGRRVELDLESLVDQGDAGLRCSVPSRGLGRPMSARFTNRAAVQLSAWIDLADDGSAHFQTPGGPVTIRSEFDEDEVQT